MSKNVALRSLVESHIQPFVVIDSRHQVVAINDAFQEAFRVNGHEAAGQLCYQLASGNARPCPCLANGEACPFSSVFEGRGPLSINRRFTDARGIEVPVRVHAFPICLDTGETYLGELVQPLSETEHRSMSAHVVHGARMVGSSPAFRRVLDRLDRVAASRVPVLLQGSTGTGKELAAHYVHAHSDRCDGPMMTIDCTVLTESLFESEIFGHERGAFTGCSGQRKGLIELADGGTLFLDEVGELSPALQAKLLRVLETGRFRRIGGRRDLQSDVRLICATNRDLRTDQQFRRDLYFRISAATVRIPSLAERADDIPELARVLLEQISHESNREYCIEPDALQRLQAYPYPGNIRELRNLLWAAATDADAGRISRQVVERVLPRATCIDRRRGDIEWHHRQPIGEVEATGTQEEGARASQVGGSGLEQVEAGYLSTLIRKFDGNRRRIAEALGVSERTVYRKLKFHNLH